MSNKKEKNRQTWRSLFHYIRPYGFQIILSLVFAALVVALTLYAPVLTGEAVDEIVAPGNVSFPAIRRILGVFGIAVLLTALFQWLMNICNNHITYHVVNDIRRDVFERLEKLPLSYIDSHQYGDIMSRVVADIDQLSDGLLMGFTQLFTGVITIAGTLGLLFATNVVVALLVVVVTPLSLFVAQFIARRTYSMFLKQSETRGRMTTLIDEMIGNEKVVKAFSYESEAEERFDALNGDLQKYSLNATFFSSLTNPSTRFVNSLVYTLVGICGALYVIKGGLSVGKLTCLLSYANQYTKPFNEISGVVTELQNALACAARVFELLREPLEIPDEDGIDIGEAKGEVELQDVAFSYTPEQKLIEHFSLKVKPGQRVAIVGPTGCGKSTVINLLMRFYDVDSGSIKVDGVDIRDMTRESLRRNVGMVLQETWLKSGTIRENIMYGKPDATKEEVIRAAKASHADSFIRRMKDGYDTVIGEDGGSLSQGQKQLLCITRVMLSLPPMLILDEATSSIDTRTEIQIQNGFRKMMEGRTSFIVAHRLSTIRESDIILVMKDGAIVEQGSHEELLKKKGFYEKLWNQGIGQPSV